MLMSCCEEHNGLAVPDPGQLGPEQWGEEGQGSVCPKTESSWVQGHQAPACLLE